MFDFNRGHNVVNIIVGRRVVVVVCQFRWRVYQI